MKLSLKQYGFLIFLLAITMLNGGCNPSADADPVDRKPNVMTVTVKNPLEILHETLVDEADETLGTHRNHQSIRIDGLRNEEVETSINDQIEAAYDQMAESKLPPYRGIRIAIPEDAFLVDEFIYTDASANFNNLLSVTISRNVTYAIPGAGGDLLRSKDGYYYNTVCVYDMVGLTFDLETGKELALKDLFMGTESFPIPMNDVVAKKLSQSQTQDEGWSYFDFSAVKLTAPFKGLNADPNYFLTPYGICLIFDYRTPEFYNEQFTPSTMQVFYGELSGLLTIGSWNPEVYQQLFASDAKPVKSLVWMTQDYYLTKNRKEKRGSVNVSLTCNLPTSMPATLKTRFTKNTTEDSGVIESLQKAVEQDGERGEQDVAYYDRRIYGTAIGNFYTIMDSSYWGYKDQYEYRDSYETYFEDGTKLTLSDLFREGFDYKPLLLEAIRIAIANVGGLSKDGEPLTNREVEAKILELAEKAVDLQLNQEGIDLTTESVERSDGQVAPLYISLLYETIGCDNLTIFQSR